MHQFERHGVTFETAVVDALMLWLWRGLERESMSTRWPMDSLASLSGTLIVAFHAMAEHDEIIMVSGWLR
ncbi:MAG: hypothetical protein WBL40_15070 [Terrimicrobiaceae bacterium]